MTEPREGWAREYHDGIGQFLYSPNELAANGEPANVADGLFAIARSLDGLAYVIGQAPLIRLIEALESRDHD